MISSVIFCSNYGLVSISLLHVMTRSDALPWDGGCERQVLVKRDEIILSYLAFRFDFLFDQFHYYSYFGICIFL